MPSLPPYSRIFTPAAAERTIDRARRSEASPILAVPGDGVWEFWELTDARRFADLSLCIAASPPRLPLFANRMSEGIASPPIARSVAIWPGSERRMPRTIDLVRQGVHARCPLCWSISSPRR